MIQYIDKAAVVAEIEKKKKLLPWGSCASQISMECNCKNEAYDDVVSLLDTIEVKEVDLEKEMNDYFVSMGVQEHENIFESTFRQIAKHFFELGIRANCDQNSHEDFHKGYIQAIEDACKWLQENCTYTHPRKGSKECVVNIPRFKNDLITTV